MIVRAVGYKDAEIVRMAAESCARSTILGTSEELFDAWVSKKMTVLMFQFECSFVVLGILNAGGTDCVMSMLYRRGNPIGIRSELREIWAHLTNSYNVKRWIAYLDCEHPRMMTLERLYRSITGMRPMAVCVGVEVG